MNNNPTRLQQLLTLFSIAVLTAGAERASAGENLYMWTGNVNHQWGNTANWSPSSGAPTTMDDYAYLYPSASDYTVSLNSNTYTVGRVTFGSVHYELNNGTLQLWGDLSAAFSSTNHTLNIDIHQVTSSEWSGIGSITLNGALTGAGAITINSDDNGQLATFNAAGSYSGTMTIQNGFIRLGHDDALQSAKVILNKNDGMQFLAGATAPTLASLSGTGNLDLSDVELSAGNGSSTTYDGKFTGSGSFIKKGSGTFTYNGNGTHSGFTRINNGVLVVGHANGLANSRVEINTANGLDVSSVVDPTLGALAGTGALDMAGNTVTAGGNDETTTYSGSLTNGIFVKDGNGTLTLSGNNELASGLTIADGAVSIASNSNISSTPTLITLTNDGTIATTATFIHTHAIDVPPPQIGKIDVAAGTTLLQSGELTSGSLSFLFKEGDGLLQLAQPNPGFIGTLAIDAGRVSPAADSLAAASVNVLIDDGLDLTISPDPTNFGTLQGTGTIDTKNKTLAIGFDSRSATYSGVLYGTGGISKNGIGVQTLSGANTYTGETTINSGKIKLGNAMAIQNSTVNLQADNALDLNGLDGQFGAMSGVGDLNIGSTTLTAGLNGASTTYSGELSGSTGGEFRHAGSGTMTLTGTVIGVNHVVSDEAGGGGITFSGATLFAASELTADADFFIEDGSYVNLGVGTVSCGTSGLLRVRGPGSTLTNGFELVDEGVVLVSNSGKIGGLDTITLGKFGDGAMNVSNGATVDAGQLGLGGTIADTNGGAGQFEIHNNAAVTIAGETRLWSDISALVVSDGTFSTGTLTNDETPEIIISDPAGGAALTVGTTDSVASTNFSGTITDGSSPGSLVKTGTNRFVLSGANTYSGGTTIEDGTLVVSSDSNLGDPSGPVDLVDGRLATAGHVTTNRALIVSGDGQINAGSSTATFDWNGVVSGAGTLNKIGDGTLTLSSPANPFSGTTDIDDGQVVLGAADALANSTVSINTNDGLVLSGLDAEIGALAGTGALDMGAGSLTAGGNGASTTYSGVMGGAGDFTKTGDGTLTLSGANTYSGSTVIDGGTLLAENTSGSATGSGSVFLGNATLGGNGSVAGATTLFTGGVLAPGASAGILTIAAVGFGSGSEYAVELAGNGGMPGIDFDQLVVTDIAVINPGAALDLTYLSAFTAVAGDTFVILDAAELSGSFDTVNFPDGQNWSIDYDYIAGTVTVGICADSDTDGVCDAADICPGFDDSVDTDTDTIPDGCDACAAGPASGDTDADGGVDLDDYSDFGACLTSGMGDGCECFDFDFDGDVDLADYAELQVSFTGG